MSARIEQSIQRGGEVWEHRGYVAALVDLREVLDVHPDLADVRPADR